MERRLTSESKFSTLPVDYLKMVNEVFSNHFEEGLKLYQTHLPESYFEAHGQVYADEVILSVSLLTPNQLAGNTVYASGDFNPKASSPTVQDLLDACVDAIASVYSHLLDIEKPEIVENFADESLSALENAPFEWAVVDSNKRKIYVKLDKSNPQMDHITEQWLKDHDPEYKNREDSEQKETENLFVTGPKNINQRKN